MRCKICNRLGTKSEICPVCSPKVKQELQRILNDHIAPVIARKQVKELREYMDKLIQES